MVLVHSPVLRLARLLRSPILSPSGERLGRVEDVIARLADSGYPRITGLKATIGGREVFVPASLIADLAPGAVQLTGQKLDLGRFERRPGEVLLRQDVLNRRLIDVAAGRLIHANDLALANLEGSWRLVGVDPNPRQRRPRWLLGGGDHAPFAPPHLLDWSEVQPFVGHVPTAGLLMPLGPLKRLHPAQIADLVEHASHDEGGEIIEAVESDPELSADVFEELDASHQEEFLDERSDAEAADLLARMEPDEAADVLSELDQNRRLPVLALVPEPQRGKLHALLQYHPATAGGMMSPDFIAVRRGTSLEQALARVRADEKTPVPLQGTIFITEPDGLIFGSASAVDVIRGPAESAIDMLPRIVTIHAHVSTDLVDVALTMADFNLTALAVVNDRGQLVGAVSVDDVLEALVPDEWRRRAQANSNG